MNHRARALLIIFLPVVLGAAVADNGPDVLSALLGRKFVDADLARAEAEAFLDSRVPPLPAPKTVAEWEKIAARLRKDVLEKVVFRGEAARWRDAATRVEWLDTIPGGPGYSIRKLRFEALPGFWISALLYLPDVRPGRVPVVLNVNGHDPVDKAVDYKQVGCINQVKRGMIALNVGWIGYGQLDGAGYDHNRSTQIDLCGSSGLAPFYLSMIRSLDLLLSLPEADPERLAMAGLSGGGWQTIFCSSLDPRVILANPVAGFADMRTRAHFSRDLGDPEQAPADFATIADYTHLVALLAPRPTLLTYNLKDECCFASGRALPPLLAAGAPFFQLYGRPEMLRNHVNEVPGTHNFLEENREVFYKFLGDIFYPGDRNYSAEEIECSAELKSPTELYVPLPEPNHDFHTLAKDLAKNLPLDPGIPAEAKALDTWRTERRALLRELLKVRDYRVTAENVGTEPASDPTSVAAAYWRLGMESDPAERWTVPAVELNRGKTEGTVILLSDGGMASASKEAEALLGREERVVAIDPFYFGEGSKIDNRYGIHISCVGRRPLGVDAAQVGAVARWLAKERGFGPVRVAAVGPRAGLVALAAAGLEEKAISSLELHGAFKSLKDIIDRNLGVPDGPELFTFGLLERFDIPQLSALVSPRPVDLR
jgi:hypothetical protein